MQKHTYPLLMSMIFVCIFAAFLTTIHPSVQAQRAAGTIAYVRSGGNNGDQIRLIGENGENDRALWTVPVSDPLDIFELYTLAWKPDGSALTLSSDHEDSCSIFASDLYSLQPDGSNFHRLGNGPACESLASYPQGEVTVSIQNFTSKYPTNYFVYVQGAPGIIGVTIPWFGTATVTFPSVADFGAVGQQVILIQADYRWTIATVDVIPGTMTQATPSPAPASGDGIRDYGAWGPTWRNDGSRCRLCALVQHLS